MVLGVFYKISVRLRAGVLLKSDKEAMNPRRAASGLVRRKFEKSSEKRLTKLKSVL